MKMYCGESIQWSRRQARQRRRRRLSQAYFTGLFLTFAWLVYAAFWWSPPVILSLPF